jgi:FKBP-type peptidyl-prolyl cis-trans isomerase 2
MRRQPPRRDDVLIEVDLNELPEGLTPEVGTCITITYANGTSRNVPIVEASETAVTLDTNHPLSGKDLTFEITLVDIR